MMQILRSCRLLRFCSEFVQCLLALWSPAWPDVAQQSFGLHDAHVWLFRDGKQIVDNIAFDQAIRAEVIGQTDEFLSAPDPPPSEVLPPGESPQDYWLRMQELAYPRMTFLAGQSEAWWLEEVQFFDVVRQRIWIFWRRLLHTSHHRTQLAVYLRLLSKDVPSTYGPTADVTWKGADPTRTVEAAGRKTA
jgi:hypothetical protein